MVEQQIEHALDDFKWVCHYSPIEDNKLREELIEFLGHKGEPWMTDIK